MSDRYTAALTYGYAHRFPKGWWHSVAAASGNRIDPALVAAVLAVESGNRGRIARFFEFLVARLLILVRGEKRFGRLSLGIAQIQPRRLGLPCRVESLEQLRDERYSIEACSSIVLDSCAVAELDPTTAQIWRQRDWRAFGWAYNGSKRYGDVAEMTYEQLRSRLA